MGSFFVANLAIWEQQYGAATLSSVTTVPPEPSVLAIALLGLTVACTSILRPPRSISVQLLPIYLYNDRVKVADAVSVGEYR